MYALVEVKGHQYIVETGKSIVVDNVDLENGKDFVVAEVLSVFDGEAKNVEVGMPFVKGAEVTFEVVSTEKGEKMHVTKFKRKTRYQRRIGFRPLQTTLKVKQISLNGKNI